jgi:hypothetical protein
MPVHSLSERSDIKITYASKSVIQTCLYRQGAQRYEISGIQIDKYT